MDWLPNSDGVNYFVREILPLIWQLKPDFAQQESRIHVTGTVPDVSPWLWGASASIVPLRIGCGTRLKIYEAMAAGTATVSTSIGAEGLDVSHPANIRLTRLKLLLMSASRCCRILGYESQWRIRRCIWFCPDFRGTLLPSSSKSC